MNPSRMKILVAAGASGGHIFPALSFLEALKVKHPDTDIFFLLPETSIIRKLENFSAAGGSPPKADQPTAGASGGNYEVKYIPLPSGPSALRPQDDPSLFGRKFPRGHLVSKPKIINYILNLFRGCLESLFILLRFQPDIVVGFGSLASVPVIMFAWLLRIKTLIHEQNVMPGRANRLLALFADKIAVSFGESLNYLAHYKSKVVVTGNPLRKNLVRLDKLQALDFFRFDRDKLTILVAGGSQGSHRINSEFLNAICVLENKSALQVIHLSGPGDYELLKHRYEALNIKFALFSFFAPMQYAYSACDVVLSRAGATTVTEIIFFELPAIFIPYPYAHKHQHKNAEVLAKRGCAIIIEDEKLNAGILKEKLGFFLSERNNLENMRAGYSKFSKLNAADLLVGEAWLTMSTS